MPYSYSNTLEYLQSLGFVLKERGFLQRPKYSPFYRPISDEESRRLIRKVCRDIPLPGDND